VVRPVRATLVSAVEDEPVAVDGFDARRSRLELARVKRADAAPERRAVEAAQLDPVTRSHAPFAADDADREQAAAAATHCALRSFVDDQPPGYALAEAEPQLERGFPRCRGGEARSATANHLGQRRLSGCDHAFDPGGRRELCGCNLALHATLAGGAARAEHRRPRGRSLCDHRLVRTEHSLDGREEHEQLRAHEDPNLRRERVVVAEGDLVGRRSVVLVHDGHDADALQLVEGVARVDVGAAVADLGGGEQHLRRAHAVCGERVLPAALK